MPKKRPDFLHRHVSRHGTVSWYVKVPGRTEGRGVRIKNSAYYSEAFMLEYFAAVRGDAPTTAPTKLTNGEKGSLGWLIQGYRKSRAWCDELSAGTRKQRSGILQKEETENGDLPYTAIKRKDIEDGIMARTENQGRHFYDTMRGLFKWAVDNEHHDRNPTDGIKIKKDNGDGHLAWPIDLIEQYEKHWPIGTKQRLMFDVYLYVGLRRGDAARLGRQHIRRGIVHLMTEKSQGKMPIFVPVHPALAASIKACPSSGLAIIAKDDGSNYTKEALGNFFREAVEAAGIRVTKRGSKHKGYSGHGLRKASATIAAESGATEAELNAMFGWSGHQMAQLYTKRADRKRLAARAMAKWVRPSSEDVVGECELEYLQLETERPENAA